MSRRHWIMATGFFLSMAAVMVFTGASLRTPATPHGIIDLELASDSAVVQNIINFWTNDISNPRNLVADAKLNTWLDFLFIVSYTVLLLGLILAVKKYYPQNKFFQVVGRWLISLPVAIALLDIFENTGMLISLSGQVSDSAALFTSVASTIKWVMLGICVIYIAAGTSLKLMRDKKSKGKPMKVG